ncbi:MAG: type VI secretion system accessory protein TagJ [Pirellula sp.]
MQKAEWLFRDGKLEEAIDLQLGFVKKSPTDNGARFFLAELAAFQGDWDRVDRQLHSVVMQDKNASMLPLLFRQLVRAEIIREQVFQEGRSPDVVVELPEDCQLQVEVCMALRLNQLEGISSLLEKSDAVRSAVRGTCNGKPFDTLIDMDDRLRGVAEVLTATGKYFWLPWNHITSIQFAKAERPLDLIWRKAEISVNNEIDGEVYMPVRYPSAATWKTEEQLGRTTSWQDHPSGLVTGRGQRSLLVGDEAVSIMDVESLEIELGSPNS